MAAKAADRIPDEQGCPGGCRYEPKFDGFRATAIINEHGGVTLTSRQLTRFNETFPEVVLAVFDALPTETVVDGEIVRWAGDGRLDFAALQRRQVAGRRRYDLARAEPCHYVVFDVLEIRGVDLWGRPLVERRAVLEDLLGDAAATSLIVACPQTDDAGEARLWMEVLVKQGIEGIVVKAAAGRYVEGRRGWLKIKHRSTTEAVVGGVTGRLSAPRILLLGRYTRAGRLRVVGRTAPLPAAAQAAIAGALTPAGDEHPWPGELPASWAGGLPGSEPPIQYTRVVPDLVAEISVDAASERGRWRHTARYVRLRTDLAPADVPCDLDLE
ncbi:ATP-dependent DNA ligase [Spirillospora sp. NBC_01491]|uniref:ATP-dependent DNA ligase n=1 Tax=Spirillospora sp. NBC_01491 TaxID=2976007 RepID=UPI002E35AA5C|nr:ATP-dependent DNA ligase [Spirillospora sp. NBC_01491]